MKCINLYVKHLVLLLSKITKPVSTYMYITHRLGDVKTIRDTRTRILPCYIYKHSDDDTTWQFNLR